LELVPVKSLLVNCVFGELIQLSDACGDSCGDGYAAMRIKTAKDVTDQQIFAVVKEYEGKKLNAAEILKCAKSNLYKRLKKINA